MIKSFGNILGRFISHVTIIFAYMVMIVSCVNTIDDERLREIAGTIADSPEAALQQLDSINPTELSTSDRHYYSLLTIKAQDKSYIRHKNDSLIMSVVNYAGNHKNLEWYPEALYYAGRVYADLGDSPTALRYFHSAIDALPEEGGDLILKSAILSQTARLLNGLRLSRDALKAVERALDINESLNDTLNLVYNHQLAGDISLRMDSLSNAEKHFLLAAKLGDHLNNKAKYISMVYLAAVKYYQGEPNSALTLIRFAKDSISKRSKFTYLAYAAQIYHANEILDTAYILAKQLTLPDSSNNNRHIAYQILLAEDMRHFSTRDSIDKYTSAYGFELEKYLIDSRRQMAVIQEAGYNYNLIEKEKNRLSISYKTREKWLYISGIIILSLCVMTLYFRNRNNRHIIRLKQSIEKIEKLQALIHPTPDDDTGLIDIVLKKNVESLRISDLRAQLRDMVVDMSHKTDISQVQSFLSLNGNLYEEIQHKINNNQTLNDELWTNLERTVLQGSPEFKQRLTILFGGKIYDDLYKTALLIKCRISPSQSAILIGRTKSTVTLRRKKLAKICFGEDIDLSAIDTLICLL